MFCSMHVVDAFASAPFTGNPAAVVRLPFWVHDDLLVAVAAQHNLSETAFIGPADDVVALAGPGAPASPGTAAPDAGIRWFTPRGEVDLCGHATLAAAHVLTHENRHPRREVLFASRSGTLRIDLLPAGGYELDFPLRPAAPVDPPAGLLASLGLVDAPEAVLAARDHIVVLDSVEAVAAVTPDFADLAALAADGVFAVAVTAAGPGGDDGPDFVSRFFAPGESIPEDPVTGSVHCTLAPYWAERLGRDDLRARQISARGGDIRCRVRGDRVGLEGEARTYLWGQVLVPGAIKARTTMAAGTA